MAELTKREQMLFVQYGGNQDLVNNDEFWQAAFDCYSQEIKSVPLPLRYNPLTVRMIHDMLDCPPGECGKCCYYIKIPLKANDIKRITENTSYNDLDRLIVIDKDGSKYFTGQPDGCPFLKDNTCTIYKYRPDVCYLFPIQSGMFATTSDGQQIQQMYIRVKCPQTMKIVVR